MTVRGLSFSSREEHRQWLCSQARLPAGFRAGASSFHFTPAEVNKPADMNLSIIALEDPTESFAAVYTKNAFPGAPVIIGRQRLSGKRIGAVVVNNKIANVCAPQGVQAAEQVCAKVGELLDISSEEVLPASTGVIGWKLPAQEMIQALSTTCASLQSDSVLPAADGILTTDTYAKIRRAELGKGSIVGIAKGAGMVEPNMATVLVFILTDIDIPRDSLRTVLLGAVSKSFNAMSVDADQSTSDMAVVLSSQKVPCGDIKEFSSALEDVCILLARDLVRGGEGVRHLVQVHVSEAPSVDIARGIGKSVVNSPLFQCAVAGNDPNVGRLVMAIGKYMGNAHPEVDISKCRIGLGGEVVYERGAFSITQALEDKLTAYLKDRELYESPIDWPSHERMVEVAISLGCGDSEFTVWGSDLTHDYVSINADYRS